MGRYITHEGLPFYGTLEKIRIRSCRATDPSLSGFNEEQLLEITRDGEVKPLEQKKPKPIFHKPMLILSLLHSLRHSQAIEKNAFLQSAVIGGFGF